MIQIRLTHGLLYQISDSEVHSMRITITGRNIELTQGLKEAVEDKLSKLDRYFTPDTDAHVTLILVQAPVLLRT